MRKTVTFFDTRKDLLELTGLHDMDSLWEAGFNLDDWDFGFVSDTEWSDDWFDGCPYFEYWLLTHMDRHCVGYEHTEYNGKHYYMLYHS